GAAWQAAALDTPLAPFNDALLLLPPPPPPHPARSARTTTAAMPPNPLLRMCPLPPGGCGRRHPVELLLDECDLPLTGEPLRVEQRVQAETVDQPQQPLRDVLRRLISADLAVLLGLARQLREQVDERGTAARRRRRAVAADRAAPVVHEEL